MKERHVQARSHSHEAPFSIIMFVCPPVCLSPCIIAAPTGRISLKFDIDVLHQNLSRNYKFTIIWAKISDTLHEDLSTFHCCWRHTFAVKRCCAALGIFMLLTVTLTQQYTENALLRFHCNNGYSNAPKCYVTRTVSVLLNIIHMRFELRSAV